MIEFRALALLCVALTYFARNTALWGNAATLIKHKNAAAYTPSVLTENAVYHGMGDAPAYGETHKFGRQAWVQRQRNDARAADQAENENTHQDEIEDNREDEENEEEGEDGEDQDDGEDEDDEDTEAADEDETGLENANGALQSRNDQGKTPAEGEVESEESDPVGVVAPPELSFRGYQRLLADAQERLEKTVFEEVFQEAKVWECLAPMICNLFGKTYYYNPYKRRCVRQSLMARLQRKKKPVFLELSLACESPDTFDVYIKKVEAEKTPLVE